jgi:hypothetical protein
MFFGLDPWSSAPVAYTSIRPKAQIFNIGHDYTLWIRNFLMMIINPENLGFETLPMAYGHNLAEVPKFKNKT